MKTFVPHPYQSIISKGIIYNRNIMICAGMGMGKTTATLDAIRTLIIFAKGPVLVVAPKRVACEVWPEEIKTFEQFADLEVSVISGNAKERQAAIAKNAFIYTVNYENLVWLEKNCTIPFSMVVIDESTRVKNYRKSHGSVNARALAKICKDVKRTVCLTGTPCLNGLLDLWGQYYFVDKGEALGRSFTAFRNRWFKVAYQVNGFVQKWTPLPHAQAEIEDRTAPITIIIRAEDWFRDLKKPIERPIYVELPEEARKNYDEIEKQMYTEIEGAPIEAFSAAAKSMKCIQAANGAVYDSAKNWVPLHNAKLEALKSIVEEWNGENILVVYQFNSDLARLQKAFPQGRNIKQDSAIKQWNTGKIPVLFVHAASAGHGLNLQHGGRIVVFFGHWWDMEQRAQVIERIGPMRQLQAGYSRSVYIYDIIARRTIDELILLRHKSKKSVQDLLIENLKNKKAELCREPV